MSYRSLNLNHSNSATFEAFRRQYFALPLGIISYISLNPKATKGLLKLQKTCKYFFAIYKNIILAGNISQENNCLFYNENNKKYLLDLINNKYWLIFALVNKQQSVIFSKSIYRRILKSLTLENQDLKEDEIYFLLNGGKINDLSFQNVNFWNNHGTLILCYQILAKVPNIIDFNYDCKNEIFNSETFENMNSLVFISKILDFQLTILNFSNDIDFSFLRKFIKNNGNGDSRFAFNLKIENLHFVKISIEKGLKELKVPNLRKLEFLES